MVMLRYFFLIILIVSASCQRSEQAMPAKKGGQQNVKQQSSSYTIGNGALLSTRFTSFTDLKTIIKIEYRENIPGTVRSGPVKNEVRLTHVCGGHEVISVLKSGLSQTDFVNARKGNVWAKILLGLKCPYALLNKNDLANIENLGRRRPWIYGMGDVAFYDLAENMVSHISDEDRVLIPSEDLSEKGYLNTFNHIAAQAFMTSVFSETTADFVADVHELFNMPELITGNFTEVQLNDLSEGPVDNYVDMINNEWGQELGKILREKYAIDRSTHWTPQLMADYLNDIQNYHSWALQIAFHPFRPSNDVVIRFSNKINKILEN